MQPSVELIEKLDLRVSTIPRPTLKAIGVRRESGQPCLDGVEAVILAGVHAWGGGIFERIIPRPLIPIVGQPLLVHTLNWLRDGGVARANVCANSDTPTLWRRIGDGCGYGIPVEYYEDITPRGPAGCVRDSVVGSDAETLLVVEGSLLPLIDLGELLRAHRDSRAAMTVVAATDGPEIGQGRGPLRPVGLYVLSRSVLPHIPATGYQDIKETLIPRLHAHGEYVATHVVKGHAAARVSGVGSYLAISAWAVEQMSVLDELPPGFERRGEAIIHESVVVDQSSRLIGPMFVDRDSRIDSGAIVVGPATVGMGCQLGAGSVVSRSVLWAGCEVGQRATVDCCVLTDGASIASGRAVRNAVHIESEHSRAPSRHQIAYASLVRSPQRSETQRPNGSCFEAAGAGLSQLRIWPRPAAFRGRVLAESASSIGRPVPVSVEGE